MKILFFCKVIKKALKKSKHNIFYVYLGYIDET